MTPLFAPLAGALDRLAERSFDNAIMAGAIAFGVAALAIADYADDGAAGLETRTLFALALGVASLWSLVGLAAAAIADLQALDKRLDAASRFAVGDFTGDFE